MNNQKNNLFSMCISNPYIPEINKQIKEKKEAYKGKIGISVTHVLLQSTPASRDGAASTAVRIRLSATLAVVIRSSAARARHTVLPHRTVANVPLLR